MYNTFTKSLLIGGCAAALTIAPAGCGESENGSDTGPAGETTAEDVMRETEEAAGAAQEMVQQKITEYRSEMAENVNSMRERINELESRAEEMTGTAQEELRNVIIGLREQADALEQRIESMQASSQQAWSDVKSGADRAWNDLRTAVSDAANRYGPNSDGG